VEQQSPLEGTAEYAALIRQEAAVWGASARDLANQVKPDWRNLQYHPLIGFMIKPYIEKLLALIQPGWIVLEIGC
jgi:hypothetical protein